MARKRQIAPKPEPEPYTDEDAKPGETLDDYMARRDEEEGRRHDDNQSRIRPKVSETWDPHMGDL